MHTPVSVTFFCSPSRMLTLREVSCCLLFHSKMGIKELISDIKGLKIHTVCRDAKKQTQTLPWYFVLLQQNDTNNNKIESLCRFFVRH